MRTVPIWLPPVDAASHSYDSGGTASLTDGVVDLLESAGDLYAMHAVTRGTGHGPLLEGLELLAVHAVEAPTPASPVRHRVYTLPARRDPAVEAWLDNLARSGHRLIVAFPLASGTVRYVFERRPA